MKIHDKVIITLLSILLLESSLRGAQISDLVSVDWVDQVGRFLTFRDSIVRTTVLGGVLLGVVCGMLGSFIVVRKMALMGDTLSHAVLPGVALGFLWHMNKDPWAIFIGAMTAGILGAGTVMLIRRTTHLKEDVSMGMVLAGFYGLGICLMTYIQNFQLGNFSGLDHFLFGQAAALSRADIAMMFWVTVGCSILVYFLFKELSLISFDRAYASALGVPVWFLDGLFMVLLAAAIVVSLQAVGVVLVSAMLITPAATAYLWVRRFRHLVGLSMAIGALSGFLGAFLSFLGNRLPTGPFMVLATTVCFIVGWMGAPRHGVIPKAIRQRRQRSFAQLENLLKQMYHILERKELEEPVLSLEQISQQRGEPIYQTRRSVERLIKRGFAEWMARDVNALDRLSEVRLNSKGYEVAQNIVRRHRLWELYLTQSAHYAEDHVHIDAERVEHILSQPALERLDKKLGYPRFDPHGKPIPRAIVKEGESS